MAKRTYDNSKREKARLDARDRILSTMVSVLAEGKDDIPLSDLAEKAGVSLRGLHQHFPDKQARLQAMSEWIDRNVKEAVILPTTFDDIPSYIEARVDYMLDNETIMRAQMASGLSKDLRSYRKLVHARRLKAALGERLPNKKAVDDLTALIISLVRTEAIFDLRDIYGFSAAKIKSQLKNLFRLALEDACQQS